MPLGIIPLVLAGISAGESIFGGASSPGTPKATTTPLTANQNLQQKQLLANQSPNAQTQGSGSFSPGYVEQFDLQQSGLQGDPQGTANAQSVINQLFQNTGVAAPGNTGLTSSGVTGGGGGGIMDLLKMPGSSGGGTSVPGGGGIQNWIQQQLQGNNFQGLS